jgi:hypothetical protein
MTRREFLGAGLWGGLALAGWRWVGPVFAEPPPAPPSLVGLARGDHLYLPGPVYAPPGVYPEGKLDWNVMDFLVKGSAGAAGFPSPWKLFDPTDRVAVMIDAAPPPLPLIMVEAVLEQLVQAGLAPPRLFIFSAKESDLFAAGFSLGAESGSGVRVYGADAVGYRGGYSRMVLDQCDKIISVARLRLNAELGMTGALFNCLNAVDAPTRFGVLARPGDLGSVAAHRVLADKLVLHFLDCTQPNYALEPPAEAGASGSANAPPARPRWEYRGMLCSADPVAVDETGKQILEAKRAAGKGEAWPLEPAPAYLEAAARVWKVGQADPARIIVKAVGDRTDLLIAAE